MQNNEKIQRVRFKDTKNNKEIALGYYSDEKKAARAWDLAMFK